MVLQVLLLLWVMSVSVYHLRTRFCVVLGFPLSADNSTHPPNLTAQVWNSVFVPVSQSERFVSCTDESSHNPSLATVTFAVLIGAKC